MVTGWLRRRLNKAVLEELHAESLRLAKAIRGHGDPFRPTVGEQYTNGTYNGINHAINLLENRQ